MTRRTLRESIFKILFRYEFNDKEDMDNQIEYALDALADQSDEEDDGLGILKLDTPDEVIKKNSDNDVRKSDRKYIADKTKAILEHLDEIDSYIEETSEGWKISRLGKAELAILRLGIYESKFDDDVPFKVAINEALELTKIYCNPDATSFVNALLSQIGDK